MDTKELEGKLGSIETELMKFIEKHAEEVKVAGAASTETKSALEKLSAQYTEEAARLLAIEQKLAAPRGNGGDGEAKSWGEVFTDSPEYKSMQGPTGARRSGSVAVGSKTNVVNASGQNQPLVPSFRKPGIIGPGLRQLTIRDLVPASSVSSNLIEYVKETAFTNAAAIQTSEGASKAESALTFALSYSPVQTLAHWIPASTQVLEDAPMLQGYINTRLEYGYRLKEEAEILSGSGVGTELSGLITNSTTYDTGYYNSSDTFIDVLLHAKTQVELSYYKPTGYVLNPKDWERIQLVKTTGSASSGEYIFANPHAVQDQSIWGLPVVSTQSMPESQFLCGAFNMAAMIWDRSGMTIEVSREHSDFFTKNLVAIRCEGRLGLTVFNALALIYGGFPGGS
jgi:HK97 family phage major capsid protein